MSKAVKSKRPVFLIFHIFMCANPSCKKKKKQCKFKNEILSWTRITGAATFFFSSIFMFLLFPSLPASQRVSTAESAPAWMKMSPHA